MVPSTIGKRGGGSFRALNDKKQECGAKIIWSGPVTTFSFPATTSGATRGDRQSDTIKEVGYDDRTMLREQLKHEGADVHGFDAPNAYTDYFMISGAKVLKSYGMYVVVATGQKGFNGRIMMGMLPGSLPLFPPDAEHTACF